MNQYADYVHVFIKPVINFVYCTPAREGESSLLLGRTLHIDFPLLLSGSILSVFLLGNEAVYISGLVLFC